MGTPKTGTTALQYFLAHNSPDLRAAGVDPLSDFIEASGDRKHQRIFLGMSQQRADESGANCINFNEFVFIPAEDEDFSNTDYAKLMLNYYFFQPSHPRLMRAWKRVATLENRTSGGHLLAGENYKLYKNDFILRHYIALSALHVTLPPRVYQG